ncbi:ZIP family metal transporter [Candidatus Parcubacteria bacterium]|jgi:zinc and cadmium transporter|nr:ZIP family metal transporter [Candidatus Parcubacteria bacterium]MBT3948611.1 ZIP family metal transporter [Candidatus Parcubacteria bacterium]
MTETVIYTLASVIIISIISLVSIMALGIKEHILKKLLLYMVSFSTGALFGGAFFHLLPEIVYEVGFTFSISTYVILGILFSFIIEKFIHWRHCHHPDHVNEKVHSFAYMNLFGDGVHNLIDGLIIGASYLVSIPVGIATTLAVVLHEIPQEIGDFGVLLHGGFSKKKAIFFNFLTALTAILGAVIALILGSQIEHITHFLVPFAAGGFIYIAGSDLIPELHKEKDSKKSFGQLLALIFGVALMAGMVLMPHGHNHSTNAEHDHSDDHAHIESEHVE